MLIKNDNLIWYPPSAKIIMHFVNQINYCTKTLDKRRSCLHQAENSQFYPLDNPVKFQQSEQLINSPKSKKGFKALVAMLRPLNGDVLGVVA